MRKFLSLILILCMILPCFILSSCSKEGEDGETVSSDTIVLNVYNWGEYMPLNEDDGYALNDEFEKWYLLTYGQKVKVNYDTFSSNEELRAKMDFNAVNYDIIIPSDYMIDYFVQNKMLAELNFDNIPNYENISEEYRDLYYDPDNKYTVPYTYGVVGIVYDANRVDKEDVESMGWGILWSEKYKDEGILQFNNSRDAFGSAMYKLGIDVNTTDKSLWNAALDELKAQKDIVKAYVMDEIYNFMEVGEAAIGAYYAGDYFTMVDNQEDYVDLQFYTPENTNVFVDAICIPKSCTGERKTVAERYINFILSEEVGIAVAEYIYYASPNKAVYTNETYIEDMRDAYDNLDAYDTIYPENFDFNTSFNKNAYRNLDSGTLQYLAELWENLKIE